MKNASPPTFAISSKNTSKAQNVDFFKNCRQKMILLQVYVIRSSLIHIQCWLWSFGTKIRAKTSAMNSF